jgi:uncharacterized protein
MQIHYLEIVTKQVDAVCAAYQAASAVQFGEPDSALGNARTAPLAGGGLVGVRAPLHETEEPVVRPYWLVDDIKAAVAAAVSAGAQVAHPPLEIPGHGTFAIYIQGGIHHGLWQLSASASLWIRNELAEVGMILPTRDAEDEAAIGTERRWPAAIAFPDELLPEIRRFLAAYQSRPGFPEGTVSAALGAFGLVEYAACAAVRLNSRSLRRRGAWSSTRDLEWRSDHRAPTFA